MTKNHKRKLSLLYYPPALLAGGALVISLLFVFYRPDRPIANIVPASSSEPTFVVQVIRPRLGLPLGGIMPPQLFGLDKQLGFDSTSAGANIRSVSHSRIELSSEGWDLQLMLDGDGRVTPETEVVFDLVFENRPRRVRCRSGDPAIGTMNMVTLEKSSELSGNFDIELEHCEDAESGASLDWPPQPLMLHGSFDRLPLGPAPRVELTDGARTLANRAVYDTLARRENFPGVVDAQEVKFIIMGVDTATPELHFINTKTLLSHNEYARKVLRVDKSIDEFNSETYFTNANRKNFAGSLVSHDSYVDSTGTKGLFTLEVWPTDPAAFRYVNLAYHLIGDSAPWLKDKLAVHLASETFKDAVRAEQASYKASNIQLIETDDLFGNLEYQPMNQGETFGRLILATGSTTVAARDIPIFTSLPNDLSTVSGIITSVPQTPLSHVNLRAKQNNTPNAFVKNATTDPSLTPYFKQFVFFKVGPDGFEIRAATNEEVDLHFEALRPSETQTPARDLSVVEIKSLAEIDFEDSNAYGAKAANLAELRHVLPGVAPEGFAIPYSFYDNYMKENGFYGEAQTMMDDPDFQSDPEVRMKMLSRFRNRIETEGTMPAWINDQLTALQASYPKDISPRLRSSANAEDLAGFSGAGLYNSFTHKRDEGHISKSVKQVWASLWNYRAYQERDFFRVDQLKSAMGILVHPSYRDELANGVGVSKNIFDPFFEGKYFNVQVGEYLVTNPGTESIPEEFIVAKLYGFKEYETQYIRSTNQLPAGERILTSTEITNLTEKLDAIDAHFRPLYGRSNEHIYFSMEIEFKITSNGDLAIKQARPWVIRSAPQGLPN